MGAASLAPGLVGGDDGRARCAWCAASPGYRHYHDEARRQGGGAHQSNGRTPISSPCSQNANSTQATRPPPTAVAVPAPVPGG